jgi:large subunit ribosomal protein L15
MRLNTLKPAEGAKKKGVRLGRGIGSGLGKTCGKGHKGQKARAGNKGVKVGFEGGQMPIQRRLPKMGFRSLSAKFAAELRLHEIADLTGVAITLDVLKDTGLIAKHIRTVKVISSGEVKQPLTLSGIKVTKGAKQSIEAAGGKVEE